MPSHSGTKDRPTPVGLQWPWVLSMSSSSPAVILHIADGAGLGGLQARNGLKKLFLAAAGNTRLMVNLPELAVKDIVQLEGALPCPSRSDALPQCGAWHSRGLDGRCSASQDANHHIGHLWALVSLIVSISPTNWPWRRMATDRTKSSTSCILWVMMTMALPSSHIAQDLERAFPSPGGQSSGLVQNQNIRPAIEDLHDLHRLLLGNGHIVDLLVGVHVKAVGIANLLHLGSDLIHIQPSGLLQPQDDISLRNGEHIPPA